MAEILLTGAAGRVGRMLREGLPAFGWKLRCFDLVRPQGAEGAWGGDDWITGDITDPAALARATAGVGAVIHLAGIPSEAPFADLLHTNIDGTYQVFEAAQRSGVPRVLFASSNHAVGFHPRSELADTHLRPRPDTYYGVSKVAGEAIASLYADRYRMAVASVRIGSCEPEPSSLRSLSTWLSPADAVRLFHALLTAPDLGYATVYGISANTRAWWDLDTARELGYQPQDDAEPYAPALLAAHGPIDPTDRAHRFLGGEFTALTEH